MAYDLPASVEEASFAMIFIKKEILASKTTKARKVVFTPIL